MFRFRWSSGSVFAVVLAAGLCCWLQQSAPLTADDQAGTAASSDKSATEKSPAQDENELSGSAAQPEKKKETAKKKRVEKSRKDKSAKKDVKSSRTGGDSDKTTSKDPSGNGVFLPPAGGGGNDDNARNPDPGKGRGSSDTTAPEVGKPNTAQNSNSKKSQKPGNNKGAPPANGGEPEGPDQKLVKRVIEIQNRNHADLIKQKGILGTATALDEDGNVVIKVYTTGADNPKIPKTLENVKVIEEMTGPIFPMQVQKGPKANPGAGGTTGPKVKGSPSVAGDPIRQIRLGRPVPIGVSSINSSTQADECAAGTLGCRVKDSNGNYYALSNNHVYALENAALLGTNCTQPSPLDNLCIVDENTDTIGHLVAFVTLSFSLPNLVDCALARTTPDYVNTSTPVDGYGPPTSTVVPATLGMKVQKYGRTSGYTRGVITALNVVIPVTYTSGTAVFVNQIEVVGDIPFPSLGAPGDSGSLVVDMNRNPVGLLFAGGGGITFCNRIQDVLDALEFELSLFPPSPVFPPSARLLQIDSSTPRPIGKVGNANPGPAPLPILPLP